MLLILTLMFAAVPAAANDNAVTLSIKPLLCVTDKREDVCKLTFLVLWEASRAGRYCLYNDFSETPLDCWVASAAGRFSEDRVVTDRFQYWVTGADGKQRLAEATVEIMTMDSSDRRRQRRSRHVWSIL